jgi:hypothetical protein
MTNKIGNKPHDDPNRADSREQKMHAPDRNAPGGGRRNDHAADERRSPRVYEDPEVTHHTVGHHHTD